MYVNYEKISRISQEEISSSLTTQECNNVATPYCPISSSLTVKCSLTEVKNKGNVKLLALKVVMVAYERWLLARSSKYSDLTWELLVFW